MLSYIKNKKKLFRTFFDLCSRELRKNTEKLKKKNQANSLQAPMLAICLLTVILKLLTFHLTSNKMNNI